MSLVQRVERKELPNGYYVEIWYKNGKKSNELYYDSDENIYREIIWYNNGKKKSFEEQYDLDGKVKEIYIDWYENGKKRYEHYCLNGNYHRDSGPAIIWWNSNGQKEREIYYKNGKKHAEIWCCCSNDNKYYINGECKSEEEFLRSIW